LESNRKDVHNRRALQLTESKILRLVRYYKRNSVLPDDWKYTLANAKLLVG
jgi:small subunit ribosomal protein S15